jgi:hypothetical protein
MRKMVFTVSFILVSLFVAAGEESYHKTIRWKDLQEIRVNGGETVMMANFTGAQFTGKSIGLPIYAENFPLESMTSEFSAHIENMVFDIAPEGFDEINGTDLVKSEIELSAVTGYDRKTPFACISFVPVRLNPYNNQFEILISFDVMITSATVIAAERETGGNYAAVSVLATGEWYKISVTQTGIHKITYNDLQTMGINPSSIDPRQIRLYGNGGGMLSESLADFRRDDLAENSIFISGESDGRFDQQDYILFYGESPHKWKYQAFSQAFNHEQNIYSDSTYYFLTTDLGPGKRVAVLPSSTEQPNAYVTKFTDYAWHERDLFNLVNTGRVWYGEVFDVATTFDFKYSFPDIDITSPAYFRAYVAAKSTVAFIKILQRERPDHVGQYKRHSGLIRHVCQGLHRK